MIKVMLVDDEVLALEYLKNIIDWEAHGYQIVGTAVNGRRALELYGATEPEIVITDIKMAGMDGLELARQLRGRDPDVVIVFLSAYRDFEYAQKGIRYGVSNYLLKHELRGETLLEELKQIGQKLDQAKKNRKKMDQNCLMNQLIYDRPAGERFYAGEPGEQLFLLLLHKRGCFRSGEFVQADWDPAETAFMEEQLPQVGAEGVAYVADVPVTPDNWAVLCRMARTPSARSAESRIRQWAEKLVLLLGGVSGRTFHGVCGRNVGPDDLGQVFRLMSRQMRQAFFWPPNDVRFLETPREEEKTLWGDQLRKLEQEVYEEAASPGMTARRILETLWKQGRGEACRLLLPQMNDLLRELAAKAGTQPGSPVCLWMDEVIRYYAQEFDALHERLCSREDGNYSRVVAETAAYIRRHYKKELSLESLGEEFHMNGVYLGQIFKKEVGVSVLKYQTALRMEEAKRLLREEKRTVSETARLVGYQTSQYFSQVFARNTGMKPQAYRNRGRAGQDLYPAAGDPFAGQGDPGRSDAERRRE